MSNENVEEVGIELLLDLSTDVVGLIDKAVEAKEDDGKISKGEIVGMLPKALAVGKDLLKFNALLAEVKDFSTSEGKVFVAHIISLGIIGDRAEIVAVNVIAIIEAELAVYQNNVVPIINALKK